MLTVSDSRLVNTWADVQAAYASGRVLVLFDGDYYFNATGFTLRDGALERASFLYVYWDWEVYGARFRAVTVDAYGVSSGECFVME